MTCDLARFAILVRRRAQRVVISHRVYLDPVAAARSLIAANAGTLEASVLARLIDAVAQGSGSFAEAEAYALGGDALAIADAMIGQANARA